MLESKSEEFQRHMLALEDGSSSAGSVLILIMTMNYDRVSLDYLRFMLKKL